MKLIYLHSKSNLSNNINFQSSSLNEWHIPIDDIVLEAVVAKSLKGPVYK